MNVSSSASSPVLVSINLVPRAHSETVGEDPGNEAEAQLQAAVRELRPR